ncbi:MAG TPA: ABC transporter permease [Pyrinomonadaceae bacterium]
MIERPSSDSGYSRPDESAGVMVCDPPDVADERSVELFLHAVLPEEPLVKIRPGNSLTKIEFGELWAHRELLYFMMWRDLKVRYRQTILGASWVILQPLLLTLVFAIFLGKLVKVPSDGVPYPIFAYAGLLLWMFLSNAVLSSSYSLVVNAHIITKVYFSRLLIPGAAVGVRLLDLIIASLILVALMFYYGVTLTWSILMLPVFVIQITALALGVGIWTSALNVRYRDVGTMLPILLQLWMFVSPIIYPSSIVPERWRSLYFLNPLAGTVEGFRASLLGLPFDWRSIVISTAITLALLVCSIYAFRRMEESFADDV